MNVSRRRWKPRAAALSRLSFKYCTDNAAMIAMAGSYRLLRGERDRLDLDAEANLSL